MHSRGKQIVHVFSVVGVRDTLLDGAGPSVHEQCEPMRGRWAARGEPTHGSLYRSGHAVGYHPAWLGVGCKHWFPDLLGKPDSLRENGEGVERQVVVALAPVDGQAIDLLAKGTRPLEDQGHLGC